MRLVYEFCGGKYDGLRMTRNEVMKIYNGGLTVDYSKERRTGALVPRKELDNQPKVSGYSNPMFDGKRYIINNNEYHQADYDLLSEEAKKFFNDIVEIIGVIRYEYVNDCRYKCIYD